MTVTTTSLTRAAGISAAVAGLLFIAVQIKHPPMNVSSVTTDPVGCAPALLRRSWPRPRWSVSPACTCGRSARHGILGLVGYLVFGAGYLVMMGIEFTGAYVLPSLAHTVAPLRQRRPRRGHRRHGPPVTSA